MSRAITMSEMKIANRIISAQTEALIIAELSANHNGSIDTAIETIVVGRKLSYD